MQKISKKFKSERANNMYVNVLNSIGTSDLDLLYYAMSMQSPKFFEIYPSVEACINAIKTEMEQAESVRTSKEIMRDRYVYEINGLIFQMQPIMFGEESEFMRDFPYSLSPNTADGEATTEDHILLMLSQLFNPRLNPNKKAPKEKSEKKEKRAILFGRLSRNTKHTYDAEYYADCPIYGLLKWFERKVTLNGKPVKFYDLERTYNLNKLEIYAILVRLMEISNFTQHLRIGSKQTSS